MKVLIKQAHIVDSSSPFNGQVKDILISDGKIEEISDNITAGADEIIANDNLHVSIGWMDIFADFCDPGFEQKETIESGAAAAAAGGFTEVMILPNTNPVISSKSQVEYIKGKAANLPVTIHPIAAITKNAEGKELSEMYDMHNSGAVAFSDGINSVQNPAVLLKALQYVLTIDATIIQVPDDKSLSRYGLMNEGVTSTQMGLPGKPAMAEELMIARDIELLKYTNARLHITAVSTEKGMELISAAKKEGLRLTCSVTPYHWWFCDEDMTGYDTNLKLDPPLRSRNDMMAIRRAVHNGTADCIASHHLPQHWDDKTCEFEYAKSGMIGLESMFAVINTILQDTAQLVSILTINPRKVFGLPMPVLEVGATANLSLFNPAKEYEFSEANIKSISRNSAFIGKKLVGEVIGIINGNKICINSQ